MGQDAASLPGQVKETAKHLEWADITTPPTSSQVEQCLGGGKMEAINSRANEVRTVVTT